MDLCIDARSAQYSGMNAAAVSTELTVLMIVVAILLIAPCALADETTATSALDDEVGLILQQPMPETEYSQSVRCLATNAYRSVEVLDTRHLLFRGRRDRVWLNQLRRDCAGLKPNQMLHFDVTGSRLCALDRFQGFDRLGGMAGSSASCGLQRFEEITIQQADRLRQLLAQRRQTQGKASVMAAEPVDG